MNYPLDPMRRVQVQRRAMGRFDRRVTCQAKLATRSVMQVGEESRR
jgi:hypothetical protein